jgi:hypothetical protein
MSRKHRIEDVFPELARIRDTTRLSIANEDGDVIETEYGLSHVEQARIQAERARNTLESMGTSVYQVISDSSLTDSEKAQLRKLYFDGGEDARDLTTLVKCSAFKKLYGQGRSMALRVFLSVDRQILVRMFVHSLSYQSVSKNTMNEIMHLFHDNADTSYRQDLSELASTHILQPHPLFPISGAHYDEKAKRILNIFDTLATSRGRISFVDLCQSRIIIFDIDSRNNYLVDQLFFLAVKGIDPLFLNTRITEDEILTSLIIECSDPGQVDQSSRGTCSVASMQYVLCLENPAEYIRCRKRVKLSEKKDNYRIMLII